MTEAQFALNCALLIIRPGIPTACEVIPLIAFFRTLRFDNYCGGNLHIYTDDGNCEDGHLQYCLERAQAEGDLAGSLLAQVLLRCSLTQRNKIYKSDTRTLNE